MCKVYVVTSGKGGVGKSTIVANLSSLMAGLQMDKSFLVIDMDVGLRNLDIMMGLENKIVFNLVDVLKNRCNISQAIVRARNNENLFLLPASQTGSNDDIDGESLYRLLSVLRENFDYIFIDCPAGIDKGFHNSVRYADEAIAVVLPDVASVRDADKIINMLSQSGIHCGRLIVNRYNTSLVRSGYILGLNDINNILGVDEVFSISDNSAFMKLNNFGQSNVKNNKRLLKDYVSIAKSLI